MLRFASVRLAMLVPVLLAVTFLSFLLTSLLPGNPAITLLGTGATPKAIAAINRQLGLNEGILPRYGHFLDRLAHGDFGQSLITKVPVATELSQRLPVTLELLVLSQLLALGLAIPAGILAAKHRDSFFDRAATATSFGLLATPSFVVGVWLVFLFAVKLPIFPASGYTSLSDNIGQNLRSMVLPSITLAIGSVAVYLRVLRSDMITTLQQDFITVARSKGLRSRTVLLRHAFRPSSLTLLTVIGLNIGFLLGGTVIVEEIFQLPGIGLLLVHAIEERDYLTVQGVTVVVAVGFVLVNFLVDLLYGFIDPRIRAGV